MKSEQIFEVIEKLVGKVTPVADASIDKERLENMQKFLEVFEMMHIVIDDVAYRYENSPYYSERVVGELCSNHIRNMGIQ